MRTFVLFLLLSLEVGMSDAQWVQTNGTFTGQIRCLTSSPNGTGGTNIFAGTDSGGVFLSTNNGISWTNVSIGLSSYFVRALITFPSNGGWNLFAGCSCFGGVFRSTNNGTSWTEVNGGFITRCVRALAVTSGGGGTNLFAGTDGTGVSISTDNGTSWSFANNGLRYANTWSLAVSRTGDTTFVFAGADGGVCRSTNNGTNWTDVSEGLRGETVVSALAVPPIGDGSKIFAGTDDGVYLSTNNGANWVAANNGLPWNRVVKALAFSPGSSTAGEMCLVAGFDDGVFLSTNGGTSWSDVSAGLANTHIRSFAFSCVSGTINDTILFVGTAGGGIWKRSLSDIRNTASNAVVNGGFEAGMAPWVFFTNGAGVFSNNNPGSGSPHCGSASISTQGFNVQLYQSGIALEPDTRYRLSFAAYCNTGHDMSVSLHRNDAPFTDYGLHNYVPNLTTTWQSFSTEFTTRGFSGTVGNGRLKFWLAPYDAGGDRYYIDDIILEKIGPAAPPTNVVINPDFESGTSPWTFFTNGVGAFVTAPPGFTGTRASMLTITSPGSNMQLYQSGISLLPGTRYRLTFAAYSSTGHDMSVSVHRHETPFTSYGLNNFFVDLTAAWQQYSVEFTTAGFTTPVNNARLRFRSDPYAAGGDRYYLDNIVLMRVVSKEAEEEVIGGQGTPPLQFLLNQNYPNPFNPTTTITFQIPNVKSQPAVTLTVFDLVGREVSTLVNEVMQAGTYRIQFDGGKLASGVYFYRLQAGSFVDVKKLILLK